MNIVGWPSEIRPAGQVPGYGPASVPVASASYPGPLQVPPAIYKGPALTAAKFLKDRAFTCARFEALPMESKRREIYTWLRGQPNNLSDQYVILNMTAWLNAINAECLRQAVAMQYGSYSIYPAGQTTTPAAGISPMAAGAIGFAIGGIVTFLVVR